MGIAQSMQKAQEQMQAKMAQMQKEQREMMMKNKVRGR